nr:BTAD domain-containing putative transcriptional regulator [Micromonospora sp. DSM 115978]
MDIRLLGPIEVWSDGRPIDIGGRRPRAVLAVLAADANQSLPIDAIIDRVWDDAPPAQARHTLHGYVTRLRRVLDAGGVGLSHRNGAYTLHTRPDGVDLARVRSLADLARANDDADARSGLLRRALDLWRGEPLAGLPGGWAATTRQRWMSRRLDTTVRWARVELGRGDPEAVVEMLDPLADEFPHSEPLAEMLIRALAAAGRGPEALDRYADLRRRLADELGCDPNPRLRELHVEILRGDPTRTDPARGSGPAGRPDPVDAATATTATTAATAATAESRTPTRHQPRQLPLTPAGITGRDTELVALTTALRRAGDEPTAPVIVAITGTAGVGKTTLAVHWAHQNATAFPDGQLYLDLRGYHPGQPLEPSAGLAAFLAGLGVPAGGVPAGTDERAALFRSLVAGRRILLVLDNAFSAEQVRPLLPGSRSCFVVVTSRDALAGLVARDGAHRLAVDVLPPDSAVDLLRGAIGDTAGWDPAGAARVAELCARLPLALRLAAEIAAAATPALSVRELLADLTDERQRLDLLDTSGDQQCAIRAVFSWSYGRLPPDTGEAFRLTALHPGDTVDRYALAALTGADLSAVDRALRTLLRAHLVTQRSHGRYTMHDLLRAYARELTVREDTESKRRAALTRLLDGYRYTAAAAMDALLPEEHGRRPTVPAAGTPTPSLDDPTAARAWLAAERRNLVAVALHAATGGWPEHAIDLPMILWRQLYLTGHHQEALDLNSRAETLAARLGNPVRHAHLLNQIGATWGRLGESRRAMGSLDRALAVLDGVDDDFLRARIMGNLGICHARVGEFDEAAAHLVKVAELHTEMGDLAGQAHAVGNVAEVYRLQGHHRLAVTTGRRAIELYRLTGARVGAGMVLNNIGLALTELGEVGAAIESLREALVIHREFGNEDSEGDALNGLGIAHRRRGEFATALTYHREAVAIHRRTRHRSREAAALLGLGDTLRRAGDIEQARRCYESVLHRYHELGLPGADDIRQRLRDLADG